MTVQIKVRYYWQLCSHPYN